MIFLTQISFMNCHNCKNDATMSNHLFMQTILPIKFLLKIYKIIKPKNFVKFLPSQKKGTVKKMSKLIHFTITFCYIIISSAKVIYRFLLIENYNYTTK